MAAEQNSVHGDSWEQMPLVLTVPRVAEFLSVGKGIIYELIKTGDLPHIRLGKHIRIPRQAFQEWLQNHTSHQPYLEGMHIERTHSQAEQKIMGGSY